MSIYLPSTGNFSAISALNSKEILLNTPVHSGLVVDKLPDNEVTYANGRIVDNNTCFFRSYAKKGYSVPSNASLVYGISMPLTNHQRGTLPMQLGFKVNLHLVPLKGAALADVRLLFMQQVEISSEPRPIWEVASSLPLSSSFHADTTNDQVYDYVGDDIVTYSPRTITVSKTYRLTGLVGVFLCFYNATAAAWKVNYWIADYAMSINYKNRPIYTPEIN